jgi:hypothetical protein
LPLLLSALVIASIADTFSPISRRCRSRHDRDWRFHLN